MEINVLIDDEYKRAVKKKWIQGIARVVLEEERCTDSEMGVLITGQEQIRRLHRDYMENDSPTDVLSFAMNEQVENAPAFVVPEDSVKHLGEVVISYPQAELQAAENNHSVQKEVTVLLIHGVLHLLGYDHDDSHKEHAMRMREKEILTQLECRIP